MAIWYPHNHPFIPDQSKRNKAPRYTHIAKVKEMCAMYGIHDSKMGITDDMGIVEAHHRRVRSFEMNFRGNTGHGLIQAMHRQ